MMIRALGLAVFLILAGCTGWPQESPQLPEKFFGKWISYPSHSVSTTLFIRKDGTIDEYITKTGYFHSQNVFKVIYVDENTAYIASDEVFYNKDIKEHYYTYLKIKYKPSKYVDGKPGIRIENNSCILKAEDWNLSPIQHWTRYNTTACPYDSRSTFIFERAGK